VTVAGSVGRLDKRSMDFANYLFWSEGTVSLRGVSKYLIYFYIFSRGAGPVASSKLLTQGCEAQLGFTKESCIYDIFMSAADRYSTTGRMLLQYWFLLIARWLLTARVIGNQVWFQIHS
jgi:hypothetical protein